MHQVTIGVVNYNGGKRILEVLHSIERLDYPKYSVVVIDNCSNDGSFEASRKQFPCFKYVRLENNIGPAGARNIILKESADDYVLLMDNDVVIESDVLTCLMRVMENNENVGICHVEIRDIDDPKEWFYYNGAYIHFLGAIVPKPYPGEGRPCCEPVDIVSGQATLVYRNAAVVVGGVDEDFFFGWEDGDFISRLRLAGYRCMNVPEAVGHHKSEQRGLIHAYYQIRNRWYFILKLYSFKTILLIAPMLVVYETSLFVFLIYKKQTKQYLRAMSDVISNLNNLMRKRNAFMKIKVVSDRDWLKSGNFLVPSKLLNNDLLRFMKETFCALLNAYWKIVQPFC